MASKADLITAAQALSVKLGEEAETKDLTNAELVKLVAGLRERADLAATAAGAAGATAGLVAQVKGLADTLGAPVETEGVSDEGLRELIASLRVGVDEAAKAAAVDDEAAAAIEGAAENEAAKSQPKRDAEAAEKEAAEKEAADAKAAEETKAAADKKAPQEGSSFYLLPGKAITSKRGILGPGDAVTASDLSGGQETLDVRIESGHIGRR